MAATARHSNIIQFAHLKTNKVLNTLRDKRNMTEVTTHHLFLFCSIIFFRKSSVPALEWNCPDHYLVVYGSKSSSNEWSNPEDPLPTHKTLVSDHHLVPEVRSEQNRKTGVLHGHPKHGPCCR